MDMSVRAPDRAEALRALLRTWWRPDSGADTVQTSSICPELCDRLHIRHLSDLLEVNRLNLSENRVSRMSDLAVIRPTSPVDDWPVAAGQLVINGIPLARVAHRIGSTPFFAYDRSRLDARVGQLRAVLPASVQIHYAIKANPMPAVVQHLAGLVDGLDVASGGELKVALDCGTAPADISFAGPGKRQSEVVQAVAAGVLLNVESPTELRRAQEASDIVGAPARVAIRVNPDFELKSSGMKMGGGPKQFGIDAESAIDALALVRTLGLRFEGFHIFSGSQNLSAASICEAQQKAYALAKRLAEAAPAEVRHLNLGGGFGIPYFPNERPLDLTPIGENLHRLADEAARDFPTGHIVIELGRFLVGESGVYVTRVVDRKVSRGQVFLVVDGGLNHHLAASGNFGQVLRKNYPVAIGNRIGQPEAEVTSVVGPLCTPLDLLADRMSLPVAEIGDFVVVFQSGAYGMTASPTAFLGHPPAAEALI
jgi:diaminopimelate decarboxylase